MNMIENDYFKDLPKVCKGLIISYLSVNDMLIVKLVSKYWRSQIENNWVKLSNNNFIRGTSVFIAKNMLYNRFFWIEKNNISLFLFQEKKETKYLEKINRSSSDEEKQIIIEDFTKDLNERFKYLFEKLKSIENVFKNRTINRHVEWYLKKAYALDFLIEKTCDFNKLQTVIENRCKAEKVINRLKKKFFKNEELITRENKTYKMRPNDLINIFKHHVPNYILNKNIENNFISKKEKTKEVILFNYVSQKKQSNILNILIDSMQSVSLQIFLNIGFQIDPITLLKAFCENNRDKIDMLLKLNVRLKNSLDCEYVCVNLKDKNQEEIMQSLIYIKDHLIKHGRFEPLFFSNVMTSLLKIKKIEMQFIQIFLGQINEKKLRDQLLINMYEEFISNLMPLIHPSYSFSEVNDFLGIMFHYGLDLKKSSDPNFLFPLCMSPFFRKIDFDPQLCALKYLKIIFWNIVYQDESCLKIQNSQGDTMLHLIIKNCPQYFNVLFFPEEPLVKNDQIREALLDFSIKNKTGFNLLDTALNEYTYNQNYNFEIINFLYSNAKSKEEKSKFITFLKNLNIKKCPKILYDLTLNCSFDILKDFIKMHDKLIDKCINFTSDGNNPLDIAIFQQAHDKIELLKKHGARTFEKRKWEEALEEEQNKRQKKNEGPDV